MALSSGASSFSEQVVPFAFWFEARPYTWYDGALPSGSEALVSVSDLAAVPRDHTFGQGPPLAYVSDVAQTQAASVNLQTQFGGAPAGAAAWLVPQNRTLPTATWPAGLVPTLADPRHAWTTPRTLILTWQNTGAALTTPMQGNALIALTPMTAWQRVQVGLDLTPDVAPLWQHYGALVQPWDLRTMLDHVWGSAWLGDETVAGVLNVPTGGSAATLGPVSPAPGTVVVLRALAAGLPSGSVGNGITLGIIRDAQQPMHQLLLDNTAGLSVPFSAWITARTRLSVQLTATTATNGVAVRLRVAHYRLTPVLSALLGIAPAPTSGADALAYAEAVLGGWIR